jgi:hypothetical protein
MAHTMNDLSNDLGYYRLLESSEKARWIFRDQGWDEIDHSKVTPELIEDVKVVAYAELTTFSATQAFMKLLHDDIDFLQWLSVWFYEETKHPLALIRWLGKVGVPTAQDFIYGGRQIEPMTDSLIGMLTSNICSEIAANISYNHFAKAVDEPVLLEILKNLGRDEMRHSVGFEFYCKRTIERSDDPERDRVLALRTAWFLMQPGSDGVTQHPVFLALSKMHCLDMAEVERRYREHIVSRMSKMLDLDIPGPDAFYDVYSRLKKRHRAARRPAHAT